MRHALIHRAEAGDWAEVWQLAADLSFLFSGALGLIHLTVLS